jgi:hypothetical protein
MKGKQSNTMITMIESHIHNKSLTQQKLSGQFRVYSTKHIIKTKCKHTIITKYCVYNIYYTVKCPIF